jgi:antirestriction protein ArdC
MAIAKEVISTFNKEMIASLKKNGSNWDKMFGDNLDPINVISNKRYRGINWAMLSFECECKKYAHNIWATYKQWASLKAQVTKGSKGTPIIFYKPSLFKKNKDTGKNEQVQWAVMRASTVFNVNQVDLSNSEYKVPVKKAGKQYSIDEIDNFINETKVIIKHDDVNRCFYVPSKDFINMAPKDKFQDTKESNATVHYYSTLFHELTHATGHEKRLNRQKQFDDDHKKSYAYEELIAETGSVLFSKHFRIVKTIRDNHAKYLNGWIKYLNDDYSFLSSAIAKAGKAFDHFVKE